MAPSGNYDKVGVFKMAFCSIPIECDGALKYQKLQAAHYSIEVGEGHAIEARLIAIG